MDDSVLEWSFLFSSGARRLARYAVLKRIRIAKHVRGEREARVLTYNYRVGPEMTLTHLMTMVKATKAFGSAYKVLRVGNKASLYTVLMHRHKAIV